MHDPSFHSRAHRKTFPARRGMSIPEVVVALVVLAAIAVVAVPRLGRAESHDPAVAVRGDLAVLRNAIELYAADHDGSYPPLEGFEAALTRPHNGRGPYLRAIPNPNAGANSGHGNTNAARAPRVAGFPVTGPPTDAAIGSADWLYDPQTGQVQPNAPALR